MGLIAESVAEKVEFYFSSMFEVDLLVMAEDLMSVSR
jgi:hypothetical protein